MGDGGASVGGGLDDVGVEPDDVGADSDDVGSALADVGIVDPVADVGIVDPVVVWVRSGDDPPVEDSGAVYLRFLAIPETNHNSR